MFELELDPIKKTAKLRGLPISSVDGLAEALAGIVARIELLEAGGGGTPSVPAITPILDFLEEKPEHAKGELPSWSTTTPFNQGYSLDFGSTSGNYYIRVPLPDQLKNITEITICGWAYRSSNQFGWGGNRIVDWLHESSGIDFVVGSSGLQLGVGEFPDGSPSSGRGFELEKWEFFAVTYSISEGLKYFAGTQDIEAFIAAAHIDYRNKLLGSNGSSDLTIGNFNPELLATNPNLVDRSFKGLIHNLRIFNKALTLEQLKEYQYK